MNTEQEDKQSIPLLPCPFCGSGDIDIIHCEEDCCGAKPRLIECQCGCELSGNWADDTSAIAAWNRRDGDPCRQGCKIKRAVKEMADSATADYQSTPTNCEKHGFHSWIRSCPYCKTTDPSQ